MSTMIPVTITTVAELLNMFTIMHLSNSCIVRFLCLKWVSFMEETVGERTTRIIQAALSLTISVAHCCFQLYTGDMTRGSIHYILTREIVAPGEGTFVNIGNFLAALLSTVCWN